MEDYTEEMSTTVIFQRLYGICLGFNWDRSSLRVEQSLELKYVLKLKPTTFSIVAESNKYISAYGSPRIN